MGCLPFRVSHRVFMEFTEILSKTGSALPVFSTPSTLPFSTRSDPNKFWSIILLHLFQTLPYQIRAIANHMRFKALLQGTLCNYANCTSHSRNQLSRMTMLANIYANKCCTRKHGGVCSTCSKVSLKLILRIQYNIKLPRGFLGLHFTPLLCIVFIV